MAAVSATSRSARWTSASIDGATCPRSARRAARLSSGAPANFAARGRAGRRLEQRDQLVVERIGGAVVAQRAPERQDQLLLHPAASHGQVAVRRRGLQELAHGLLIGEVVVEAARRLGLLAFSGPRVAALEQRACAPVAAAPRPRTGARPRCRPRPRARRPRPRFPCRRRRSRPRAPPASPRRGRPRRAPRPTASRRAVPAPPRARSRPSSSASACRGDRCPRAASRRTSRERAPPAPASASPAGRSPRR